MADTIFFLTIYVLIPVPKIFRQIVGFSMGTYCMPLVADLYNFVIEITSFSLSDNNLADFIESFNSIFTNLN